MNYEHKGVAIEFREKHADFHASVKGKHLGAPSLTAIKAQIDKALETLGDFKPFMAIHERGDPPYKVTGVAKKDGRRYSGSTEYEFTIEQRYNTRENFCVPDTAANRKTLAAYLALKKKNEAEIARLTEQVEKARMALPRVSADEVATGKVKPWETARVPS